MTIRTITPGAHDDLTNEDYKTMYKAVWAKSGHKTLSAFVANIFDNSPSKSMWSQWHNDDRRINWTMRNKLRAASGMPLLPYPTRVALSDVDETASVVSVTTGRQERSSLRQQAILVETDGPITITTDGTPDSVRYSQDSGLVTTVTAPKPTRRRDRRGLYRPVLPEGCRDVITGLRNLGLAGDDLEAAIVVGMAEYYTGDAFNSVGDAYEYWANVAADVDADKDGLAATSAEWGVE